MKLICLDVEGVTMLKRMFTVFLFVLTAVSCSGNSNQPSVRQESIISPIREEVTRFSSIQVDSGQVLPSYGMQITAETVLLKLRVNSTLEDAGERMADVQNVIGAITAQTSENEQITLEYISVNRVDGSYSRGVSESSIQSLEVSSVTLTLAAELAKNSQSFLGSVIAFDEFVNTLDLTDTITIEVLSLTTMLGDLETYRHQLIAQVYEELDSVREAYGQSVQFEITGLYDDLQTIQLNDTEYYIYLVPNITVSEF